MFRVELKEGTEVSTFDGKQVGKFNGLVLDPSTNEVTHIIVQRGELLSEDKVIPFKRIRLATEDKIELSENIGDLDELPPFHETHYVRVDGAVLNNTRQTGDHPYFQSAPAYYWYPPHEYLGFPAYGLPYYTWPPTDTEQNALPNTVPITEQTSVISSDGKHVGEVERMFLEPGTNKVTHFLISEGLLFHDRKLVPANWIKSADDEVQLIVPASVLERLPAYQA